MKSKIRKLTHLCRRILCFAWKSHALYRLLCLSIVVDEASLWKRSTRQLGNRPFCFFPALPPLWLMLSLASRLVIFPALPCDLLPRLAPHDFLNLASLWFLPCASYLLIFPVLPCDFLSAWCLMIFSLAFVTSQASGIGHWSIILVRFSSHWSVIFLSSS